MAICAMCADIFEDQAGVTLCAGDLFVHSAQRIACVIVIEFRIRPDGFPTRIGVAVLAGGRDGAMGIRDLGLGATDVGPRFLSRLL